jgi:hypothetical protein
MKIKFECQAVEFPLGVVKAHIEEGINQITLIDLELASSVALKADDIEAAIGTPVKLVVEDMINNALQAIRWDGVVFEFIDVTSGKTDNGVYLYTMVVRPKLWDLNYSTHCRSYPDQSRIQVIDALLKEHGFSEGVTYKKDYYKGNSDLSFLRSLLVNAGINYYFTCEDDGASGEMLHLLDNVAFFPNFDEEIPIVSSPGMIQASRRIEEITRLTRAVPNEVSSTAFLADGSTRPMSKSSTIEKSGTTGVVNLFVPEGLADADKTATQASKVISEGLAASRITHQGVCDHLRVRPGRRLSLKNYHTSDTYRILVMRARHTFEQSVLAALSDSGSGDPGYKNYFIAVEPMAPIRPMDTWTDVDTSMALDSALDLDPEGNPTLNPKFKYVPRIRFNPENRPEANTKAIQELTATVTMLQEQVRTLRNHVRALESTISANGSGLVAAEITKDAWVTEGKELVCMVKAEEFEDPIRVKVSTAWHDKGGGMLHLPRKGNHVWIQRIHRSKGNDWVILGYRPTGAVASSNDPAQKFTIKQLG